jgi:acyl carrier protein
MTSHQEYADRLITLVNQVLGTETTLTGDSDLVDDVGLSSVQIMELIENVEDEFEIAFPLNDLANVRTLNDLVSELTRHVDAQ